MPKKSSEGPALSDSADGSNAADWPGKHPHTPDGRYFVVRGRLWRLSDPALDPSVREGLVSELMAARRALRRPNGGPGDTTEARARVDAAKQALGERGPVWWSDGTPDYNRKMVVHTPYAEWFASLKPR